jgi:glutamate dehydrogenase/leucine dehydrogenase
MGGGKGGSNFNPKGKTDREVMRFCQAMMSELHRHIGEDTDVPAGDIGVGAREISYLFGQYKRLNNRFTGVMTGKGLSFGGSLIRKEATGYGVAYFIQDMLRTRDTSLEGKTVTISGSGNVALYAVEKVTDLGGRVVTLSDSGGTIYDPAGIDAAKLDFLKELKEVRRGRISEYAEAFGCEYRAGARPWTVACDVAIPCATQNELDGDDAGILVKNGCQLVAEGANMPCTLAAVHLLNDARVLFGPAKAANAGGVAVSGLEQSQNALRMSWSRDEVDERLDTIMEQIHDKCVAYGRVDDSYIDYARGANVAGFVKVAEAMLAYGIN